MQQGIKAEYRAGSESFAWMLATDLRANSYDNLVNFLDCTGMYASAGCVVGEASGDNETDEQVVAFYGEAKYRAADKLVLTLNGRTDRIDLDYTDVLADTDNSKSFNVFSTRLGANYAATEQLDYYANVSTGFRAPR